MANLITLEIQAPPQTTQVTIAYYDDVERKLLQDQLGRDILGSAEKQVSISTADLCTYFLYYKLRSGLPHFGTHAEVTEKWATALVEFDGQIDFTETSIRLLQQKETSTGTMERFGEAVGLAAVGNLHGLHQADWTRIPIKNTEKSLDYRKSLLASDGKTFIEIECKGSAVNDNRLKTSAVSNHKSSIKAKKAGLADAEKGSSILYGTISVLDERPDSIARCWLVDPPSGVIDDPLRFKVISRLTFMAKCISFLGARSSLAASLQTRLSDLVAVENIGPLEGRALLNGSGEKYPNAGAVWVGDYHPWFSSKSVVRDGPAGGHVFAIDKKRYLFIGIQDELVSMAQTQSFRSIAQYNFVPGIKRQIVDCAVSNGRFKSEFRENTDLLKKLISTENGYARFTLEGNINYSQSGLVWGVLL